MDDIATTKNVDDLKFEVMKQMMKQNSVLCKIINDMVEKNNLKVDDLDRFYLKSNSKLMELMSLIEALEKKQYGQK